METQRGSKQQMQDGCQISVRRDHRDTKTLNFTQKSKHPCDKDLVFNVVIFSYGQQTMTHETVGDSLTLWFILV